eukprot:366488-Chlamydomonas_euryale.AAC.13
MMCPRCLPDLRHEGPLRAAVVTSAWCGLRAQGCNTKRFASGRLCEPVHACPCQSPSQSCRERTHEGYTSVHIRSCAWSRPPLNPHDTMIPRCQTAFVAG